MAKRILILLLVCLLLTVPGVALDTRSVDQLPVAAPSAILMEKTTGTVLYEKDAYAHLPPASVTKVMTMLLAAEAIDSGEAMHT